MTQFFNTKFQTLVDYTRARGPSVGPFAAILIVIPYIQQQETLRERGGREREITHSLYNAFTQGRTKVLSRAFVSILSTTPSYPPTLPVSVPPLFPAATLVATQQQETLRERE